MRCLIIATVVVVGIWSSEAGALETVVANSACHLEGLPRPLRQTIVVVDEAAIESFTTGKASETNRRVNRTVLNIAGVLDGQSGAPIAPRERITILFAREDGSDLIRAFTGCPPVYSQEEINDLEAGNSGVGSQLQEVFWSRHAINY